MTNQKSVQTQSSWFSHTNSLLVSSKRKHSVEFLYANSVARRRSFFLCVILFHYYYYCHSTLQHSCMHMSLSPKGSKEGKHRIGPCRRKEGRRAKPPTRLDSTKWPFSNSVCQERARREKGSRAPGILLQSKLIECSHAASYRGLFACSL